MTKQAAQRTSGGEATAEVARDASGDGGSATAAAGAAFELTSRHVDPGFYFARNPDVMTAGADAAEHYWHMGWREGRDPNAWFQTDYYLRTNPDVRTAGINPLWHFLTQGRHEGRPLRPAGDAWRDEFDRLDTDRPPTWNAPPKAPLLGADAILGLLSVACRAARGLVVAISHDRYLEVPGGTQLLVADEQRKFNGDRAVYMHLSPIEARLGLAAASPEPCWFTVILDGAVSGIATAGAVTVALAELPPGLTRLLVVHALHGHRPEAVVQIARTLRPRHAFFWVHDYGTACASPRLLCNNIAFCHAPPPHSLACRVCAHGETRQSHLARVREMFDAVAFDVVAPSAAALAQWQRAVALPANSLSIHPHVRLEPLPPDPAGDDDGPVRVAFVGQPVYHKGWGTFRELVAATQDLGCYRFHQFASRAELASIGGVTPVAAETSAADPFGMTRALAAHRIDLVLALSPWPETFGYVAHEALASGADVIALAGTGNIAAMLRQREGGIVLEDAAALGAFFATRAAEAHARARRAGGRAHATLVHCGSTATLALGTAADPVTTDPDLHLLVGGDRLDGQHTGETWRFALPNLPRSARRKVGLRSRHMTPLWERADGADRRRLGVAVSSLRLNGRAVPPGDPRRATGWHPAEDGWQWTDGEATIVAGTSSTLDVTLVRIARYWTSPLLGATAVT